MIVSDGANYLGAPGHGRSFGLFNPANAVASNPDFLGGGECEFFFDTCFDEYLAAMSSEDATTFAANFDVDANGVLTSAGMSAVLDGFQTVHPTVSALDAAIPADRPIIDAHRLLWKAALADMTPWQLFRGYDDNSSTKTTDAIDVLVKPANAFGFEGRPAQNGHYCRPHTPFGAYGRADELVRVGDGSPVSGVAPFSVPTWLWSSPTADLQVSITDRLDDWFREACDIAGRRGSRIHAIYIGGDTRPEEQAAIALLEECVDRGYGGNPLVDKVHATPTARQLKDAIEDIMDIKRTLRFVGS